MSDASDVLAKFAPIARCERRIFTKIKRGSKAIEWCAWCQQMMKLASPCPVAAIIAREPHP